MEGPCITTDNKKEKAMKLANAMLDTYALSVHDAVQEALIDCTIANINNVTTALKNYRVMWVIRDSITQW